ncbi:MAG: hypothetical protein PHZ04_01940 [Patescibacteria group bacterium]|nr:hypothetical protein [Patescibacteria group bacterium]MDD5294511.1 hypothetical protein [Patescibacteria group bacterium]MDD5555016.1 hypothetical protein [Patescibacteria group bacterium]
MIKKKFIFLVLIFVLLLAGCGQKPDMDQSAADGNFHYQNKDLGFSLVLPPEFLYYQTQRKETADYVDLEFFVPTADTNYYQDVAGYGKAVVIRIFNEKSWEQASGEGIYQKLGENKGWLPGREDRIYTIKFWGEAPLDWQEKWSEEIKQKIIGGFKVI